MIVKDSYGECGLDYNRDFSQEMFKENGLKTGRISQNLDMPLFLYERELHKDLYIF